MSNSEQRATHPQLTLGWRMRMALEYGNVSVAEMMAVLGVKSRDTTAAWLHDRRPVRDAYQRQWALKCGVPVEWLMHGDDGPQSTPDPGVRATSRKTATPATIHRLTPRAVPTIAA